MLNYDYKTLSKILSILLSKVLPKIIAPHQTCSVPKRFISTNGLLLGDLIQIADECYFPVALIRLDQLK